MAAEWGKGKGKDLVVVRQIMYKTTTSRRD